MYSGSTNDSLAWDISEASKVVEHPDWPSHFCVIGDDAFVCTNNFLTPYSGFGPGPCKDAFNFYLSSMRHNFCIDKSDVPLRERFRADLVEGDEFDEILNEIF